jgi:hypothetical protein
MDLTYYPFDEHSCSIYFGSWAYHGRQINITTSGNNITLYINYQLLLLIYILGNQFWEAGPWYTNSEWSLTKGESTRSIFILFMFNPH